MSKSYFKVQPGHRPFCPSKVKSLVCWLPTLTHPYSPSLKFVASPSHVPSMSPVPSIQNKNIQSSRDPPEHEGDIENHLVPADQFSVELLELFMSHQLRSLSPKLSETIPPQPRPADWVRMLSRVPLQHLWSRKRALVHLPAISTRSMQRWLYGQVHHRVVDFLTRQLCITECQLRAEEELSSLPLQELFSTHQHTRQHPSLPYIICMMALRKQCILPNLTTGLLAKNNWEPTRLLMIVKDAFVYWCQAFGSTGVIGCYGHFSPHPYLGSEAVLVKYKWLEKQSLIRSIMQPLLPFLMTPGGARQYVVRVLPGSQSMYKNHGDWVLSKSTTK